MVGKLCTYFLSEDNKTENTADNIYLDLEIKLS